GAVAEAKACLSDAVQALTGCTVGNKYLKIYDEIGRYAIVLYDRTDGKGFRIFVDLKKIKETETPELHKFFHRKRAPEVQYDMEARALSAKKVVKEFTETNHDIFGVENVMINDLEKEVILSAKVCSKCGESFTYSDDAVELCLVCSKKQNYYSVSS
ncbi:MAG: FmdE family protein, partial [Candidatus Riflebacteria bacterium]|nr:FmdE family protein [Candidatus Riflebacteria bacterium]